MKRLLIILLILINSGLQAATYYVSNSGNDSNSGLTPELAWQTFTGLYGKTIVAGDSVLFSRNNSFYGALSAKAGSSSGVVYYGAYGTGSKPIFHSSYILTSTTDWTEESTNVWKTTATYNKDVGNVIFGNDTGFGRKVWTKAEVSSLGKFWYDYANDIAYLYCTSNPTTYYSKVRLCLTRSLVTSWGLSYHKFENLSLQYCGGHGFSFGGGASNITITNCDVYMMGGGELAEGGHVQYGNGVDLYESTSDVVVSYCSINQCFDAGVTHQNRSVPPQVFTNISYYYNIIQNCEYSFEYFNVVGNPATSYTDDILFANNTCINAGGGWGHAVRPDPSGNHIQIWNLAAPVTNFSILNNIFKNATGVIYYYPNLNSRLSSVITQNNNVVYTTGNIANVSGTVYSAAQHSNYKTATGWDSNSIFSDPLFTSLTDFNLQVNSPAINSGVDVGLVVDYAGHSVIGLPDIGAYEYYLFMKLGAWGQGKKQWKF